MRILLSVFCTCFALAASPPAQAHRPMDDPGKLGHYAVGHTSYMQTDTARGNRPVYLDVWYPVDAGSITGSASPAQYPLDPYSSNLPISSSKDWEAIGYDPAYEGSVPSNSGPFPLLMFSTGFGNDSWQQLFIGTRLASHGYVVAVVDHYADCQWSWSPCDDVLTAMVNRPRDVSFAITELLAKSAGLGDVLSGTVDHQRIAVSGHSLGGYAAYALTGGDRLVCDVLAVALAGIEPLPYPPNTCVRTFPDRRTKAMISLDGSSWLLRYRELAKIVVPTLIMGETVDQSQAVGEAGGLPEIRSWIARPHAAIDRLDSYRVDVNGANHYSFTNYCDGGYVFFNLGLISGDDLAAWENSWPCSSTGFAPVTISSADEHLVVTKYMIAFLDVYFRNRDVKPSLDRQILTEEYALDHKPQVQFFNSEHCEATLPDKSYFSYRAYQVSSECDVQKKDPTGWFTPKANSGDPNLSLRNPAVRLGPPWPF